MSGQCIAVVTCGLHLEQGDSGPVSPTTVIKGILDVENFNVDPITFDHHLTYKWNITNKYYEADVDICHVQRKNMIGQQFSEEVEAVIALFDSQKKAKSLSGLESWLSYFDVWEPEIKLAVCERCASVDDIESDLLNREEVQTWCLDKGFELVELNPVEEDYDLDEDFGITRIKKALGAHMWPKMRMKTQKKEAGPFQNEKENVPSTTEAKPEPLPTSQERINSLLSHDDFTDEVENNFEALFQKMNVFKETAAAKSGTSRMDYAEEVVTAFWKAIGGDEDELRDSSSDDG